MSHGSKPKKIKAPTVRSALAGTTDTNFNSDFGSGSSFKDPTTNALTTTSKLADFLQPIPKLAGAGIGQNLGYLQQTPQQQYEQATGGQNPLYNLLAEQTKRGTDQAMGRALVNAQGAGTRNSTTAGAAQGSILNDQVMRGNQDLLNAINFSNQNAQSNLGANLNTLGSLANLTYPLGSAANSNLMQAFNSQDQAAMANAQMQMQAAMQNAQAMNQYNQQKSAGLGNMIGGGIGLLGSIAAAPFTGGMSLSGAPAFASMLGGGSGGGGGGGGGWGATGGGGSSGMSGLMGMSPSSFGNYISMAPSSYSSFKPVENY